MVKRSPFAVLISEEVRHSMPTFLKAAKNASKFVATRIFPRSNLARKVYHGFRNWYEAGWPLWSGGETSYLPSLVQDARWDANYITRREMLRRMRYWSQNSPLLESILSVGERYTVGASGLHVSFYPDDDISEDSDNSWYERADKVVQEWFQSCGWNGETMSQLLKIGYRCQKVDGEIFYIKTRKQLPLRIGENVLQVFKPVLQMVEAHRVETPFNKFDDYNLIDGVQFEIVNAGTGTEKRQLLDKVGFWVRNGMGTFEQNDSWNLIRKENIFQICNVQRANMYRGLSDFYSCGQELHKLEDLLEIEMKAHASQSIRAVGIESNSGQINPLDKKLEAVNIARGLPPSQGGPTDFAQRCDIYRKETGAYIYGLKTGEKIHFDSPNRPGEATLQLWEFLVNSVCAGSKIPRLLVFEKISGGSARSQGTEVRAQLDSADGYFKGDFQKWRDFVRESVLWFMEWAIKNDSRVVDPPADWRECLHIQAPESCNVDIGYTTQADLMNLAAGTTDYEILLGRQGLSFITVAKRLARQQKLMEKLGIKTTLPALMRGEIQLTGAPKEQQSEPASK